MLFQRRKWEKEEGQRKRPIVHLLDDVCTV